MRSLITPEIFHDLPLDPGDEAFFRFEDYANTLARLIAARQTRTPLVIGVSGKWGAGKTTLLKLLRAKLDEIERLERRREEPTNISFMGADPESAFRRCRTVWFNAWKYADEDSLLAALVRAILAEMASGKWNEKLWSKILDKSFPRRDVLAAFVSAFHVKFPGLEISLDPDQYKTETPFAAHTAFFDHFSEAFDQLLAVWVHGKRDAQAIDPAKGVLVVFIDDLDRCLPARTVQVLEAVKLFLDRPGAVFVVGADTEVIEQAVTAHYQNSRITGAGAKDYLEKIFQLRFTLPPLAAPQMGEYVERLGLDEGLRNSVDLILAGAETNPRRIKTFVNYLNLGWAVMVNSGQAEGVSREDFTRWLALTAVAPEFCERVSGLPRELRLKFIGDAAQWARGLETPGFAEENAVLVATFKEWEGNPRFRRLLKQTAFSEKVNEDVLEGFIFWSAPPPEAAPVQPAKGRRAAELTGEEARARPARPGEWVKIPAGKFVMGSKPDDKSASDDERPQHSVDIPYEYLIARTPVTNAQFLEFVEATGYRTTAEERGSGYALDRKEGWKDAPGADWRHPRGPESSIEGMDDHPVVLVSWHDARAYCEWLTGKLRAGGELKEGQVVRLPTEAEWEKAARGEYGNIWPWGDKEPDDTLCNFGMKVGGTTPVGKYSPAGDSPYGVADMAGNVWEWCSSLFKPYPYRSDDGREDLRANGNRVVRGGSWFLHEDLVRSASRYWRSPDGRSYHFGFRCARSL